MLELFIFETFEQLEQLEQAIMSTEAEQKYCEDTINEIFRIMHTIKGSAAMMLFNNISKIAHVTEDLFYYIRESKPKQIDISSLCDLVLESSDFIKFELEKIKNGDFSDGDEGPIINRMNICLQNLKELNGGINVVSEDVNKPKEQFYISSNKPVQKEKNNAFKVTMFFEQGCGMENLRAFTIVHNLKDITDDFYHIPEDIMENDDSSEIIKKDGFTIYLKTDESDEYMKSFFENDAYVEKIQFNKLDNDEEYYNVLGSNKNLEDEIEDTNDSKYIIQMQSNEKNKNAKQAQSSNNHQSTSMINVNVEKLDKLMDLVGEMVISESMVTQNPDLKGLTLNNFAKASRQLKKIISEVQDTVMSIRMVPLGPTFFKMNRIVRDMSKKLNKEVHLDIIGEDTEVDKNIIEHIGDPIMHIVRNCVDHGIETIEERIEKGKDKVGTITLEAKNAGSEVVIIIKDDGKGLNKDKIIKKAMDNGILYKKPEEMTDKEIFNLISLPGFSTKEAVTEFSGRGVGMDVVLKNIEAVGGTLDIESAEGNGTTMILKIPLTLAIISGMNIRVGKARYTIPITAIKESFRPKENQVFKDLDDNEMIMIRGRCYRVLRLNKHFKIETKITQFYEGILIMVENEDKAVCLFADELIGEQQVVVKSLPKYIKNIKKVNGLAGCTLLGDGSISLILDVNELIS
jgi:two-component system chemotaxis sensor kinase CheA